MHSRPPRPVSFRQNGSVELNRRDSRTQTELLSKPQIFFRGFLSPAAVVQICLSRDDEVCALKVGERRLE